MWMWVRRVHPRNFLRPLRRLDVQVDRDCLAVAPYQHTLERLGTAGVDLLMRHVGRHIDEIARTGFRRELELLAPTHAGASLDDVDDALEMPVMMRASLGVGVDMH